MAGAYLFQVVRQPGFPQQATFGNLSSRLDFPDPWGAFVVEFTGPLHRSDRSPGQIARALSGKYCALFTVVALLAGCGGGGATPSSGEDVPGLDSGPPETPAPMPNPEQTPGPPPETPAPIPNPERTPGPPPETPAPMPGPERTPGPPPETPAPMPDPERTPGPPPETPAPMPDPERTPGPPPETPAPMPDPEQTPGPPPEAEAELPRFSLGGGRFDPLVMLRWGPPRGVSGVTGYQYRVSEGINGSWQPWMSTGNGTKTSYVATGLEDGRTYRFQVRAVTDEGYGPVSTVLEAFPHSPSTLDPQPDKPGNLQARGEGGKVLLSWDTPIPKTVPLDPASREHIFYYLYREVNDIWRITESSAFQVVDGLEIDRSYTFELKAVSQHGVGDTTSVTVRTSAATTPAAPGNLTATVEGNWINLAWSAPIRDGGAPITTYEYQVNDSNREPISGHYRDPNNNNCLYQCRYFWSVNWVDNGWEGDNHIRVRARNSVGPGPASNEVSVSGSPRLSVADTQVLEGPGATLDFVVTMNRSSSVTITVDYATTGGTAAARSDYTAVSGTLTFTAGETEKIVSVTILEDAIDEGNETLKFKLSNPTGAHIEDAIATGTIMNTDPMPLAWLSRFGREAASHVADAVEMRIRGREALESRFAEELHRKRDEGFLREEDASGPSLYDLLRVSSFHLALSEDVESDARRSLWGRGAYSSFGSQEEGLTLSGDVSTAMLGFDLERSQWLLGLALSHSTGEGSFGMPETCDSGCAGEVESTLTGLYPYARYQMSEKLSLWGVLGHGRGELTLRPAGVELTETVIEMDMAAVGARGVLLPAPKLGGFELAVRTDALFTSTGSDTAASLVETEGGTNRLRLLLEGSRAFKLDADAVLMPVLEVGLRHDGGDAETGNGLEVGTSFRYAAPSKRLTISVGARRLLTHEEDNYEEWGLSGSVRIDPDEHGRGLSMHLGSAWGASSAGAEQLWGQRYGAFRTERVDTGAKLDAEVAYGFEAQRALVTPYTGVTVSENVETWRAGTRWRLGPDFNVNLEASLKQTASGEKPGSELVLVGSKRW